MRWLLILPALLVVGCAAVRSSSGGGDVRNPGPRVYDANDIALPEGYAVELVARDLNFPSGVAFDGKGAVYVVEAGYSYGEVFQTPRLVKLTASGVEQVHAGKNGPWTGVTFKDGAFFIAEGGVEEGGRIVRVTPQGERTVLVEKLPSFGDHHTNSPAIGPDGAVYFSIGTATNSGFVGKDNEEFGWVARHPEFHDIPCADITLEGNNLEGTGAFLPKGTASTPGQVVKGAVPCSGAVLKVPKEGGAPELVAWGFRNPFAVAFRSDGSLFVAENGFDVRGSRPVYGAGDQLFKVTKGTWYGWPDYVEGLPVNDRRYRAEGKDVPVKVLKPGTEPGPAQTPAAIFPCHSSSNGFDFSRSEKFGHAGEAFVAQYGDMGPKTAKLFGPVGFKVVRVNVDSGVMNDFAVNRARVNGPASLRGHGGLERPVDAKFDPSGESLYVVDFGVMTVHGEGPKPVPGTGAVWRIFKKGAQP